MKKLIALILLTIFIGSSSVKIYRDFTDRDNISISLLETEDDNGEREIEKENDFKKDKLITFSFCLHSYSLSVTQKFYINQLHFLPNPFLAKEIIPPNAA